MLGVSRTWLYDAAKTGRIPSVRIGAPEGPVRFVREDRAAWLDEARRARFGRGDSRGKRGSVDDAVTAPGRSSPARPAPPS